MKSNFEAFEDVANFLMSNDLLFDDLEMVYSMQQDLIQIGKGLGETEETLQNSIPKLFQDFSNTNDDSGDFENDENDDDEEEEDEDDEQPNI